MRYIISFLFPLFINGLYAQQLPDSPKLSAYIEQVAYQAEGRPYSEVHLSIDANTINHTQIDSLIQGELEITIAYLQNDTVVHFNKSVVSTPLTKTPTNFFVIKRTGIAKPGEYDMQIFIKDLKNTSNTLNRNEKINIRSNIAGISEPLLLANKQFSNTGGDLEKNGFILEALPYNFYSKDKSQLHAYLELYDLNTVFDKSYIVSYMIVELSDKNATKPLIIQHKNMIADTYSPILLKLAIDQLPSGNYKFICSVRGRDLKEYYNSSIEFQRSNPYLNLEEQVELTNEDRSKFLDQEFVGKLSDEELHFSILSIAPLVDKSDGDIINATLSNPDKKARQLYLFNYWVNKQPINPELAYNAFMEVARAVDQTFRSGFRKGIETDRGYIYLKYGQPNDVIKEYNEPDAFPYEIWSYNGLKVKGQTNVKFLFYNPSKASQDFLLLHSTCYGETQNPRWEIELYRSVSSTQMEGSDYRNGTRMQDNGFRNARRYFEN
jgi:GWxTD domain-containing protein